MSETVTLQIDGTELTVPKGTLVVDAAKRIGNDIPVFCYHPKMSPVGMCRMCLVEIGLPIRDRQTGEVVRDEAGEPKYNFGKGLQTACTVPVSEGMVVRTETQVVDEARESVIEFLLTSHPLDCPICDKGGECPLQNLTMRHGEGESRFNYDEKMKLDKHVPLGDLIFLDRERCIQCARCTRFQAEVVDDPVIGFHNRGRRLEIVTFSDPGFDSYWSGNTTDICPVGALTTADFRFGARPWELTPVASICPHCPVGCNTTMSTRREARAGGREVIKRIMPRQNEQVNEIWICDKGRFVHHFADANDRLRTPLIRRGDDFVEADWEEALTLVAENLGRHKGAAAGLAGDRLSNEDLFIFQKLIRQGLNSNDVAQANPRLAGGDVIAQVGISQGSNLLDLGPGDAIVVIASDLHEEAPVWWLRVKQAAERGATLVTVSGRATRLDQYATHTVRCQPDQTLQTARQLVNAAKIEMGAGVEQTAVQTAGQALAEAENLVIFYGYEGLTYDETDSLARLMANLLLIKEDGDSHAGQTGSGLIAVWPHNNTQGAWDMGIHPAFGPGYAPIAESGRDTTAVSQALDGDITALYVVGADPIGDGLMDGRGALDFLVVQELFMTETAAQADVVLPAQSWAEREGTYTNGERRVQRFYPAIPVVGLSRPDWHILATVGQLLGLGKAPYAAGLVFREIAQTVPQYAEMDYRKLARVEKQWPDVGGEDLYYGGTAYNNQSGLGMQWATTAESGEVGHFDAPEIAARSDDGLRFVATAALYQPGTLINHSQVLAPRMAQPTVSLHQDDAAALAVNDGDQIALRVNGRVITAQAHLNDDAPAGLARVRGVDFPAGMVQADMTVIEQEKELA